MQAPPGPGHAGAAAALGPPPLVEQTWTRLPLAPPSRSMVHEVESRRDDLEDELQATLGQPERQEQAQQLRAELRRFNDWLEAANYHLSAALQGSAGAGAPDVVQHALSHFAFEPGHRANMPCVMDDGSVGMCQMLVDDARQIVMTKVKTIATSLYGDVKIYCVCTLNQQGVYVRDPNQLVVIKFNERYYVDRGITKKDRRPCSENPVLEMAAQLYLGHPGHPGVMQLKARFQDRDFIMALYERGRKSLMDIVSGNAVMVGGVWRFPPLEAVRVVREIAHGLYYMHCMGVCNRDLSLENIMEFPDGSIRLIDLGLCCGMRLVDDVSGRWAPLPHGAHRPGKPRYMAPEVWAPRARVYDGCAADVWCLGMCTFVIVSGVQLYERPDRTCPRFALLHDVGVRALLDQWSLLNHIPPQAVDFLERTLVLDPAQRLTMRDVLQHPFIA